MAKNEGKKFEQNFQKSAQEDDILFYRIKDPTGAFNPKCMECPHNKTSFSVKNEFDCFLYKTGILLILELKSTLSKSLSFGESIIKPQQIKKLTEFAQYYNVFPGFIINFRTDNNNTYFLHINDFNEYIKNPYKKNKKSIPINYCQEVGIEIKNWQKKVNYRYNIDKFIKDIYQRYTSTS